MTTAPASELSDFWQHQVTAEPYTGAGANGSTYAAATTVPGFLERKRRLVRAANGEQLVSESTFYADPVFAATLTARSRVTVAGEPPTVVLTLGVNTSGDLDLPDHVAAALQ